MQRLRHWCSIATGNNQYGPVSIQLRTCCCSCAAAPSWASAAAGTEGNFLESGVESAAPDQRQPGHPPGIDTDPKLTPGISLINDSWYSRTALHPEDLDVVCCWHQQLNACVTTSLHEGLAAAAERRRVDPYIQWWMINGYQRPSHAAYLLHIHHHARAEAFGISPRCDTVVLPSLIFLIPLNQGRSSFCGLCR